MILGPIVKNILQTSVDDAKFGEWPHVCAVLKKEYIGDNVSGSDR